MYACAILNVTCVRDISNVCGISNHMWVCDVRMRYTCVVCVM